jgi:hypothetical protein
MKKPKSGSIWKDSSTGAMYRVAHVTRNHVLLVGDLGAHTVQSYE